MNTTNFLRECKDITINLGNDTQKDFVMDLLMQAVFNNFEYEYNGEKLNIVDLNDRENNGIHIVLQKVLPKKTVKKIVEKKIEIPKKKEYNGKKRGRKPGTPSDAGKYNGNVYITGYMPEGRRYQYGLEVDEKFIDLQQLADYIGITKTTLYAWIKRNWIKIEN